MMAPPMRCLLFNKQFRILSCFTDRHGRSNLADFIKVPAVYAAGRLDFDSEGLMVLTGDGALQKRISDPRSKLEKTYWAQVEGVPNDKGQSRCPAPAWSSIERRTCGSGSAGASLLERFVKDPPLEVRLPDGAALLVAVLGLTIPLSVLGRADHIIE